MYARSKTGAGFTIVEVMVVLAIAGLMFVLAAKSISGKQQQTEFTTGVGTLKSQLNEDLSNVADGNYTLPVNTTCSAAPPTVNPPAVQPKFITGSAPDGTCTLIGEVISFNDTPGTNNQETYSVFPVIGRNFTPGGQVVTDLEDAIPYMNTSYGTTVSMPFGLTISRTPATPTTISDSGVGAIGLFSFTSFQGGTSTSGSNLNSGSSHVEIFAVKNSSIDGSASVTSASLMGAVNGLGIKDGGLYNCLNSLGKNSACVGAPNTNSLINPPDGVTICLNSGTDNESVLFTIGGSNSATAVSDQTYSKVDCTS